MLLGASRKRRSEENPSKEEGDAGDSGSKHIKSSLTCPPDSTVQETCKLFLSTKFGKEWTDAIHCFQNFKTLHSFDSKAKLKIIS